VTRDPLEEMVARDAGVRELVNALAGAPADGELAGQQAAVAMFAACASVQATTQLPQPHRHRRPRRQRPAAAPRSFRFGARLTAATAVIALALGFAAAGYAAVLPAPLQRVAHSVLGSLGVPDVKSAPKRTHHSASPSPAAIRHHKGRHPGTGKVGPAPSPTPQVPPSSKPDHHRHHSPGRGAPHKHEGLTVDPSAHRIRVGRSLSFTVTLDQHGRPEPNVSLHLVEYPAAGPSGPWQQPEFQTTNARGQAYFFVRFLTVNTAFVVAGPGSLRSGRVKIVVIPRVAVSVLPGQWSWQGQENPAVVVNCFGAEPGDTVKLEILGRHEHWHLVSTAQLRWFDGAAFTIPASQVNRTYRAVLLATPLHGRSVSADVSGKSDDHWNRWTP
jgi:hypothetical protein